MTGVTDRLFTWKEYYENIMQADLSDYQRDIQLAELMTILENHFRIPIWKNEEYSRRNPDVMEFYRIVSNSRVTI